MNRGFVKTSLLAGVAALSLAAAMSSASAGGFASRQQSATGLGFAFAGAGTSAFGLGSMFWNPANVTNFNGRNSEWNLTLIAPDSRVQTTGGNIPALGPAGAFGFYGIPNNSSGDINQDQISPASYNSYQLNDMVYLGLQTGAPFGSRTKPDAGFAGSAYGFSTIVRTIAVTPTVGIKLNEWIAFGLGVTIQQLNVDLKSGDARFLTGIPLVPAAARPTLGQLGGITRLKGDSYGIGFTAGVTLKPWAGGEVSLGFRSSIRHSLEGELTNSFARTETLIKSNVNLPEIVTLGLKQDIGPQWTVTGTVQWTNWSRVNVAPVTSRVTGAPITGLGFRYRDEWFFAAGAQYKINENWAVRAGVAYELSPITDETRGVRVLDANRLWLSAGVGYKWNEKLSVDLGYSYLKLADGKVNIVGPGNALNPAGNPAFTGVNYTGTSQGHAHLVSLSLKYRWDDPAPSARPIVKKF
jgi:long-chain fatty acid transport protein